MPQKKAKKVSKEVLSRCTKCKEETTHIIVAMVGDEIKKVECQVCGGAHAYHPLKPVKEDRPKPKPKKPVPKEKTPKLSAAEKNNQIVLAEWRNAIDKVNDDRFKAYLINGLYQEDDYILHTTFGKGQVKELTGVGKMEVLFESGVRRLVFNWKK